MAALVSQGCKHGCRKLVLWARIGTFSSQSFCIESFDKWTREVGGYACPVLYREGLDRCSGVLLFLSSSTEGIVYEYPTEWFTDMTRLAASHELLSPFVWFLS
ncbi:unnamed protein product [Calypogeia fissa]